MKNWNELIQPILNLEETLPLRNFILQGMNNKTILPETEGELFLFTNLIQPDDVKLLVIDFGSDNSGLEDVNKAIREVLYSELIEDEWNEKKLTEPSEWAKNGILYLSSTLTKDKESNEVKEDHYKKGWNLFFNHLTAKIQALNYLFINHKNKEGMEKFGNSVICSSMKAYVPELIKELSGRDINFIK